MLGDSEDLRTYTFRFGDGSTRGGGQAVSPLFLNTAGSLFLGSLAHHV